MRILMQTTDRAMERSYLMAAAEMKAHRLCVLHGEAQTLERAFRDPFDALIVDDRDGQAAQLFDRRAFFPDNRFLLFDALPAVLSNAVTYCFFRSTPPETVLNRIVSFPAGSPPKPERDAAVSRFLQRVGVPVHLTGFYLLKEAIRMILAADHPTDIRVGDELYAALSALSGMQRSAVEHAIRHAIGAAWLRADLELLESVFGYTVRSDRAVPSNAAFLFTAAERIRLENRGGNDGI